MRDLLHSTDRPLGEDELVGLFERSAVARDHALIRRLAVAVLSYDGPAARSEWARICTNAVAFSTGPRLLDVLSDAELDEVIRGAEAALDRCAGRRRLVTTSLPIQLRAAEALVSAVLANAFGQAECDHRGGLASDAGWSARAFPRPCPSHGAEPRLELFEGHCWSGPVDHRVAVRNRGRKSATGLTL